MSIKGCPALLISLLLLPVCGASAQAESTEVRIVTKVGLTDCCIEYRGLINAEANDGVYELYEQASPKPTTILIESTGGGAGAAMQLGNWILDHEMDVQVDTYCYSSCANYIFLAGRTKLLASHASIMWHGGVMQPIDRAELEHLLDDMLNALEPEAREAVLAERPREVMLEQLEASRLELISRETRFFDRIGVDERITVLGHLFEHELLAQDHDYSGWDLSLADLQKLGVQGIEVIGGQPWTPLPSRDDVLVYRIALERLAGFEPRIPKATARRSITARTATSP